MAVRSNTFTDRIHPHWYSLLLLLLPVVAITVHSRSLKAHTVSTQCPTEIIRSRLLLKSVIAGQTLIRPPAVATWSDSLVIREMW